MSDQDTPITLDQLRVFLAVVEEGSFSKAAKRLRRVQSAVSYSIANLERLLEVELFDRSGRRPALTEAGRALLSDARAVDERVDLLQARARTLAAGVEPRVSLAVSMLFPMERLLASLRDFAERFESVDLHLRTEALGAITQLVVGGHAQIGISGPLGEFPHSLTTRHIMQVEMTPVCAPNHRLASLEPPLSSAAFAEEVQIVVTDRSPLTEGEDRGVLSGRTWRVADLTSKLALLVGGFGWGRMPRALVSGPLESGELVELDVTEGEMTVPLIAVTRTADPPGPAGAWLLARLATEKLAE